MENNILRKVISDSFVLFLFQISSLVIPIFTLPYLTRVLDVGTFGVFSFFQGLSIWLCLFIEYGFQYSGARRIVTGEKEGLNFSVIFSEVIGAQIFLGVGAFGVLCFIYKINSEFQDYFLCYFLSYINSILTGIFPIWYYQGVGKLKKAATFSFFSRVFGLFFVFILIDSRSSPSDLLLIYTAASGLALLLCYMDLRGGLILKLNSVKVYLNLLRSEFHLFAVKGLSSIYGSFNLVFLGLISSPSDIALYASVDKIVRAALSLIWPVVNSFYPYVIRYFSHSDKKIVYISFIFQSAFGLSLTVAILIFSDLIVKLFLGDKYLQALDLLIVYSFLPFVVALSSGISFNFLIPRKMDSVVLKSVFLGAVLNIIFLFIFSPGKGAFGMVYAVLIAEGGVLFFRLISAFNKINGK